MHGDQEIDRVCDDFEAQWRSGKRPRIEAEQTLSGCLPAGIFRMPGRPLVARGFPTLPLVPEVLSVV